MSSSCTRRWRLKIRMSAFPQPLKFLNLVWRLLCFVWLRKRKYRKKHQTWTKYVNVAKRQKCFSSDFGYYQLSQRLNCDSIPFNIDNQARKALYCTWIALGSSSSANWSAAHLLFWWAEHGALLVCRTRHGRSLLIGQPLIALWWQLFGDSLKRFFGMESSKFIWLVEFLMHVRIIMLHVWMVIPCVNVTCMDG